MVVDDADANHTQLPDRRDSMTAVYRPPRESAWTRWLTPRLAGLLALLLAAALLITNELGLRAADEVTQQREAMADARQTVARLLQDIVAMESAQRGYMLTGRTEYREPYDRLRRRIGTAIRAVRQLAERPSLRHEALPLLADAAERKLSELQEVLRLFEQGDREASMELMLTGIGREQMERLHDLVNGVLREAERAYVRTGQQREQVRTASRIALAALVLLCLAAVIGAMRLNRERAAERRAHLQAMANERDKLEAEVQRRTAELTDLAQHLQTVREDERGHLARELHDELGGLLTSAKLQLALLRRREAADSEPRTAEPLQQLGQLLDAGIALKRRIIEDLRPTSLRHLGLTRTLEQHSQALARSTGWQLHLALAPVTLDDAKALVVFRFVQEALTNVARHAAAKNVWISVQPADPGEVAVSIRDDGVGFDPAHPRAGSHGLAGMRFRVQSCGGRFTLTSAPGAGTEVLAVMPGG
jgi:signal transduction histidine kinase